MISELIVVVEFLIVLTLIELLIRSFVSPEVRSSHNFVLEFDGSFEAVSKVFKHFHKLRSIEGFIRSHHLEMKGDSILLIVKRKDRLKMELIEPVNFKNEFLLSMVRKTRVVIINLERVIPFLKNILGKDSSKEELGIAYNIVGVEFGLVNKVANVVFNSFVGRSFSLDNLDSRAIKHVSVRTHTFVGIFMHKQIGREKVPEKVPEHQKIGFEEPRMRKLLKETDVFLKLVGTHFVLDFNGRSHGPDLFEIVLDDVEQIIVETNLLFQVTRLLVIISILPKIGTAIIASSSFGLRNMEALEADGKALAVNVIKEGVFKDSVNISGGYRNLISGDSFLGDILEVVHKILFFSNILISLMSTVDSCRSSVRLKGVEKNKLRPELWFNNHK